MKKSYFLAKYTPVTDLIDHIVEQTKAPAGKTHFYHDALSLMCAKESIVAYMEEKGVLDRWILPRGGLFGDEHENNELKNWCNSPVAGNLFQFMPLDNSLNQDVHLAVNYHQVITKDLKKMMS